MGKKVQSTGNNPVPVGNFLPPLNPQTNMGSNSTSTKNVQSNNNANSKPPQNSNVNNLKDQNRDAGPKVTTFFILQLN